MSDFIDSKDQSIISLLQKDGRMSVKDIAKAMGLTRTTVTKRMERLEASGVITGYSAVVRKDFFDKKIRGWVMINTIPNLEEAAISAMKMIPEVSRHVCRRPPW